ncbi:uncharacterized protein N7484_003628 [Penicillium longicatenatum]|uniref:uncharacterized protein n=1 Tax=Penicillium longicatenatum TaxID=1561947 RepID=UPI002546E497|nr:uncharacterized protein N7484_003628 [Penicillium longicatenatum]KAJ5649905.1 hypothetical protein N7484_003628 [Penicillium longicatenatum]
MQPISRARNYWTAEEDQILKEEATLQVNSTGNVKNWSIIATKLKSRTNKDCRKRWSKLQTNVNKGIWSSEEDHRLRKAVEKRGLSWTLVAQDVQTRHADHPNLIRDDWNEEEDVRLLEAVQTRGRAWREISEKEFPRRSSTDLKNRYAVFVTKRRSCAHISCTDISFYNEDA